MQTPLRRRLLASTILIGATLIATPAVAQDTAAAEEADGKDQTIVVTGSLIANPNLERSAPVNVTTKEEIELRQSNTAEQLLRELPGVVPSIGSAVNNGNGGASFVDLRNLGSFRNVVLIDGDRIAPSGLVGRVDLNNIPLALIERTEVLTGGASTTYGADAIAGVVNFVTKRNFAGLDVTASQQISERGDGNVFRIDATIGANFDDGRGNVIFSVGYQQADPIYQGARSFARDNVDSYTGVVGGGSGTAVPSRISGTRPLTAAGVPNTSPTTANGGVRQIDPTTGRAVATFQTFNFNPYNIFQTPFERFNIFGQGNYELSDGVEVYSRGIFSKNTVKTIIAPSGVFGSAVSVNLNNPYLPSTVAQQLCAFDVDPRGAFYQPRYTPAECSAAIAATGPSDPNYRVVGGGRVVPFDVNNDGVISAGETADLNPSFTLARRTTEVGPRISNFVTTIFDYKLGLRGDITDSIRWDVSGAYGESENIQTLQNYVLTSRARQSLLASRNAAGQIVCNDTSNGCVPVNFFGAQGTITPNQIPFLTGESTTINRTSLAQARGLISGDVGAALPWTDDSIAFAAGAEYRKYTASQRSDSLSKQAGELGGAGGAAPDITGGYEVYEAFGELIAPIISDKPFFNDLTIEAGIRYSSYKVDAANSPKYKTTTYKVQGGWEPTEDIKFRGVYSRAVRAPNISELFSPINTGLTNLGTDPCAGNAPVNNANLRAVCIAQGAPVGTIGSITNPTAGQANVTGGGNLFLKPEKSDSYTVGAVFTPGFLPGFSASVDYFNIKIVDAITNPTPGDLILACFGATPTNPPAGAASDPNCTRIRRNPQTGGLDGDPATTAGLFQPLSNQGRLFTDGIDVSMNYNTDLGFARLALSFAGTWTHSTRFKSNQSDPTGLDRECVGFYSVNCSSIQPEFTWNQRTTLTFGDVDVSLLWRHLSAVQFEPQQFRDDLAAALADPAGCPNPLGADSGGCMVDPAFRTIPAENYFDLSTRIGVGEHLTFTLTVTNLLDNKPKVVGSTIGSTSFNSGNVYPSSYDALGRSFRVSANLRF